jgi:NADP-dependent 3-hydroxy acid dehydrogenase YdfG
MAEKVKTSPRLIAITGASRGIGAACAVELACEGVVLALMARAAEQLEGTARACQEKGAIVHCFGFELSKVDAIKSEMEKITSKLGPIHVLVNNAGICIEENFATGDMDAFDMALDVNLKSAMHVTRAALGEMPEGGAIIFIASTASRKTYGKGANYCAAKHGLLGFAGALFDDIRSRGIKVSSILPGVVDTDMHKGEAGLDHEKMIQPEDVAKAVAYVLASPAHVCPAEITLHPQRHPKARAQ